MPQTSPCPDHEELERIIRSRAPAGDVERFAHHLETCGACADAVDMLLDGEAMVAALRQGPAAEPRGEEAVVEGLISRLRGWQHDGPAPISPSRHGQDQSGGTPPNPTEPAGGPATAGGRTCSAETSDEVLSILAPPEEPDELGRFGPYGILRVLGRGGMGIVFAARQSHPRRVVALKVMLAGLDASRQRLGRFHSETEWIARLHHPNVVQVYETGEHDGRAYFTMEHLDGGSLAQQLAVSPLVSRAAAELVQVLARAVHFAHEHGIVHRDLKPANVLLAVEGEGWSVEGKTPTLHPPPSTLHPKITDFGLAKQVEDATAPPAGVYRTESGAILGTPSYMAPEQAGGASAEVGPAADVYALGAILYECLTGRPPFKAATVLETLEQVRSQEPVAPGRLQPRLPRELDTICLKCLEKDRRRRYASAQELADELGRFLRGEPILARPVRPWERAWKWARRHPSAAGLVVVSAVSLATVVTGVVIYHTRLVAAVTRAEAGEARARQQQLRADANYREARDTVQHMLRRLDNQGLAGVPRLRELEQQQLEDALAFYQGILRGMDSPEPDVRLDVARACRQTAKIQSQLGRRDPAQKNLRQAIELIEGLRAEDPNQVEYRVELAAACTVLGHLLGQNEAQRPEAERWLKRALALNRELAEAEPTAARRHNLAETLHVLALVYFQLDGHFDESRICLDEAAAIWEELLRDHPGEDVFRYSLATTYNDLGHYHEWHKPTRWDAVATVFRKAEPLLRDLVARNPGKIEWAATLASLYAREGNLLLNHDRKPAEALKSFTRALETTQAMLKQEPHFVPARTLLVHAHGGRAYCYGWLKRYQEALPEWDRVVELVLDPDMKIFRRSERAVVLARAGDHVRAAAEAAAVTAAAIGKRNDEVTYNAACTFSLAIAAALKDQRLSEKERKALAERYAGAAAVLLRRLRASGFFKDRSHIRLVNQDKDLAPLRQRPEGKKLLRELATAEKAKTERGTGKRD